MAKIEKYTKEYFQKSGKKGGLKTAERGRNYYVDLGKFAMKIRWSKDNQKLGHVDSETPKR